MSPKPDFFIVGAARCGTTALFNYLAGHPAVFLPERKEPTYFCTDLRTYGEVATLAEYEALFSAAPPQALTGEASVLYLYSKVAIGQIMAHNVNAKIIAMLRNPIEAARSMHAFWWSNNLEDVGDFERRVLAQVPRKQCLFLLFEEFFADPARQFARVLEFLGLPPDPSRTDFPVVNPTIGVRSPRLDRLLRRPAPALTALRRAAHAVGLHPLRAVQRLNQVAGQKPPLGKAFRAELEEYFSADVAELEQLLGLGLWRHAVAP